jgi:hypothetical protein
LRREYLEDETLSRFISAGVLCLWLAATSVVLAEDAEDVAMERRVRSLALGIGKAYACTGKEGQAAFKEEAHHLFDLIIQDVGSDLAYTYATAIGIGSAQPKDKLDCPARLKDWQEIREDYDLKENK